MEACWLCWAGEARVDASFVGEVAVAGLPDEVGSAVKDAMEARRGVGVCFC